MDAIELENAKREHDDALFKIRELLTRHRLNLFAFPGNSDAETAKRSLAMVNEARQLLNVIVCSAQLVTDSEER